MAKFVGGEKLEAELKKLAEKVGKGATLRVGFLEGATYPDGTPVALVAAVQEFGAPSKGIPPRPFFRNMIAAHSDEWPKAIGNLLVATGYDAGKTLALTGEQVEGLLRQSIVDFVGAPLAEATVQRKGSDKQLVDSAHMLGSVDFDVTDGMPE